MTSNKPRLIFVHIPKAAGSTLGKILRSRFSKPETLSLDARRIKEQIEELECLPSSRKAEIRFVEGHAPYGLHECFDDPSVYVSMVRDPVARVVSLYRFALVQPGHYLHRILNETRMDLEDFVLSALTTETDNGQVRFLAGHDEDIPYGGCDEWLLETAKQNILRHFAIVGTVEDFDRSLVLMSRRLGWGRPPAYSKVRVNAARGLQVRADVIETIERTNALDRQLYDWVRGGIRSEWDSDRRRLQMTYGLLQLRNRLSRSPAFRMGRRIGRVVAGRDEQLEGKGAVAGKQAQLYPSQNQKRS